MKYSHGTQAGYRIDACRCPECTNAARLAHLEWRHRLEPATVAAGPARDHVQFLTESGVGLKQIAKVSGVAHGTLWKLVYGVPGRGPSKRVRKTTQDRLLAVQPNAAADGARVDAAASWKLIDDLVAAGVPKARIATALGQRGPGLQLGRKQITAGNARAIASFHADWKAGRVAVTRTHSRGVAGPATVTVTPPPAPRRQAADISDLILDLAEVVELRNSQPWRADAACRGRPTYMWFPARGDGRTRDKALSICDACTVRTQCRAEMLDEPDGIYGGLSAKRRRAVRGAA